MRGRGVDVSKTLFYWKKSYGMWQHPFLCLFSVAFCLFTKGCNRIGIRGKVSAGAGWQRL